MSQHLFVVMLKSKASHLHLRQCRLYVQPSGHRPPGALWRGGSRWRHTGEDDQHWNTANLNSSVRYEAKSIPVFTMSVSVSSNDYWLKTHCVLFFFWFPAQGSLVPQPATGEGQAPVESEAPEEAMERLAHLEQLVVQLKELIRDKDTQLVQKDTELTNKDEQLKVNNLGRERDSAVPPGLSVFSCISTE